MRSDWRHTTWGDEISLEYGKGLRGYQDGVGPIPVFGTNGQVGWTEEGPLAPGPGIILGRKGAYRGIRYSHASFYVIDTAYFVRTKTALDMRWLYYAMIHHCLGSIDDGSPIPSTTRAAVYVRELSVPADDEQRAIAKILGDLDDKIDVLRQANAILDEIARTLFRAWFVDFLPVKAKAEGATSFRGMPQELFDALPNSLERSEIGEIPTGWGLEEVSALLEVNPHRSLQKGAEATYVGMADLPTAGATVESWANRGYTSGMRFQNGDTLLARITPCLENGKTALIDFLSKGETGWGSTEFIIMAPKHTTSSEFIYCLARDERFREFAIKNMTGTSGRQRVSHEAISKYRMARPPSNALEAFEQLAKPYFLKMTSNRDEISCLTAMRDTLLPKLISGELEAPRLETLGIFEAS